ncbi:hypothetical protein GCM10010393_58210 [Streptomyces gobitricini]|uniref:MFS transporter n=1 Tax=Streptomyces gobitricini TaxID=68211 RepID=A0ABN3NA87_9ACTN
MLPGMIGVLWLGDASRPGLAWLAVLGFVLAVAGAVAVAWFGAPESEPPRGAEEEPGELARVG